MFAEESLETRLVCTQETGEIPPQESDSAANWPGMLRPVFVTACCFRCLGKHPLSLQSISASAACAAGAQPKRLFFRTSEGLAPTLSPASVSHTQNPHLILLVMLTVLFSFFLFPPTPPPQAFWALCRKNTKD